MDASLTSAETQMRLVKEILNGMKSGHAEEDIFANFKASIDQEERIVVTILRSVSILN